jgi:hypothetical protein
VRWWLAVGVAMLIAIGAVGAGVAGNAPPEKTYFRLAVGAEFTYDLDYGSHPQATFNGTYSHTLAYTVNAIAVYDGRTVSVPRGLMLVEGLVVIEQHMTQRAAPRRVPLRCRGSDQAIFETKGRAGVFSAGSVSVSNSGLSVDPGEAVRWNVDCSATEQLESHGLLGGPQFVVPAPARSWFDGKKVLSIGCKDEYSHPSAPPDGHSFKGYVRVFVRFTPFPASKLAETKKALRDMAGKELPAGYAVLGSRSLKDCL